MGQLPSGTVTFVLTDIEGSTRHWERHTQGMDAALARHNAILQESFTAAGGFVVTSRGEGDSVFAVFQSARQAVEAAVAAQRRLRDERWPDGIEIKVRMALHSGEADLRGTEYHGHAAINRSGRLRALAHGGQVLVSATTRDLVYHRLPEGVGLRSLGEHRLKDIEHPEHVFQVTHPDLEDAFPPLRAAGPATGNLPPQLTSFVGREREVEEVRSLLGQARLVTLTGAAGAGKTRLALQVAGGLHDEYAHGVCLVELAPLGDPALVPQAVVSALALRPPAGETPEEVLVGTLQEQRRLLLFDNCEHLIDACARLTELLLKACPSVQVLATSREPLGVPGELSWRVPSLTPTEAEQLFSERAALARRGFQLDAAGRTAVASICRRLDGIPLAIELAAARVRMLPPDEILRRLEHRFRLLTGGSRTALERHQTLRAAVDWSYALLEPAERELFRTLSVFAGSFDLEAVAAVVGGEIDEYAVMDRLARLVDKSLLTGDEGAARYRMLETLRQYGHERLVEEGGIEALRGRHLDFYLRRAEQAGRRQPQLLLWDLDNFRVALDWSQEADPEKGLRLLTVLAWLFTQSGLVREGRARMDLLLPRVPEPGRVRAWGLYEAGWLAWWLGDFAASAPYFDQCAELARRLGENGLVGRALQGTASIVGERTGAAAAAPILEEALALFRQLGDRQGQAACLMTLATGAAFTRDVPRGGIPRARQLMTEVVELRRQEPDETELAAALGFMGLLAANEGNLEEARGYMGEALAIYRRQGTLVGQGTILGGLMWLAALQGELELAVQLGAAAERAQLQMGLERFAKMLDAGSWYAAARERFGEERVAELIARGQAMTIVEAGDLATERLLDGGAAQSRAE